MDILDIVRFSKPVDVKPPDEAISCGTTVDHDGEMALL